MTPQMTMVILMLLMKDFLVHELRKELRITSDHDTTDDRGNIDAFDERLLAIFKAAMIKTCGNDNSYKTNRSHLRVIHQPLKRGKIHKKY
jgi:hypothetical protein